MYASKTPSDQTAEARLALCHYMSANHINKKSATRAISIQWNQKKGDAGWTSSHDELNPWKRGNLNRIHIDTMQKIKAAAAARQAAECFELHCIGLARDSSHMTGRAGLYQR